MAEETKKKSWQVPRYQSASRSEIHGWAMQQVKNGLDILEASPGFQQLDESIRILTGSPTSELEKKQRRGYSKAQTNRLKRNLREMVNTLAEIRYNPAFKGNRETHDTAETLNKFGEYWYTQEFIDLQVKKAIQWMAIGPCGWLEIIYRQFPGQLNKKEIACIPHSWFDVVMTGLPETGDFQEAYTVTIIKEYPVYLAHALHPESARDGKLQPDKTGQRGVWAIIKEKSKQALRGVFGEPEQEGSGSPENPSVTLYEMRVLDLSINRSGKRMKMGYEKTKTKKKVKEKNLLGIETEVEKEVDEEIATPWSYDVPFVGEMIQSGFNEQGQPEYKAAKPEQCRIFPGRRLLIDSETDNIYDGPDFNFHGRIPLVKFAADSWPFGDFSMVHDVAPIHQQIQEMDRIQAQTLRNRFDPTMGYNIRAVDRDKAKTVRLDIQGDRIGFNGEQARTIADAMSPLVPHNFNVIDTWVTDFLKYLMDQEDYQMGVRNFEALAKLKMGASGDSIDKLLEAAGPIVKGISRDMERQMRDLADLFKYLVFQYKTTADFILVAGVDRVTPVNFDYEPGNMIPSHLPDERKSIQTGIDTEGNPITKPLKSIYSRMERARWAAEHIKFFIAPGTLHEITQTAHKMLLLQLWRAGAPVDPWTLFEALKVGDLGPVPEGANSMLEKWHAFKMMEVEFQAALAAKMKALMGDEGGGIPNAPNLGKGGGQKGTGGRPASGQASPKLAQKDSGARTIVKESN